MQNMFTGTYTVNEEKGNKVLRLQRKRIESEEDKDPPPDIFYIKSVSQNEMNLLVVDGAGTSSFWIFKRA